MTRYIVSTGSETYDDEWTPLAYRGRVGCRDLECTTKGDPDRCYGRHCSRCHAPTSMQGHDCPEPPPGEAA